MEETKQNELDKTYSQKEVDAMKHKHSMELNKEKQNTRNIKRQSEVAELYYQNNGRKGYFQDFYKANKGEFIETEDLQNTFNHVKANKSLYFENSLTMPKNDTGGDTGKPTDSKKTSQPKNSNSQQSVNEYLKQTFEGAQRTGRNLSNYSNLSQQEDNEE